MILHEFDALLQAGLELKIVCPKLNGSYPLIQQALIMIAGAYELHAYPRIGDTIREADGIVFLKIHVGMTTTAGCSS